MSTSQEIVLRTARAMLSNFEIVTTGPNEWLVKNGERNSEYQVTLGDVGWTCQCKDHTNRHMECKHIKAVQIENGLMDQGHALDKEPTVTASYRRSTKIGDDYLTVELGVEVPIGASDALIASAMLTGERAYVALHAEVEARIAHALSGAPDPNAPSQKQLNWLSDLLVELGVPPEEHAEALALLGGPPTYRSEARVRIETLLSFRKGARRPAGWRWSPPSADKPKAKARKQNGERPADLEPAPILSEPVTSPEHTPTDLPANSEPAPTRVAPAPTLTEPARLPEHASIPATPEPAQASVEPVTPPVPSPDLPAPAEPPAVTLAKAFKLPSGTQSHPEWKGKTLGELDATEDGRKFIVYLASSDFTPKTPEGHTLKSHATTLRLATLAG